MKPDKELEKYLEKMLPDVIERTPEGLAWCIMPSYPMDGWQPAPENQMLYACSLIEEKMDEDKWRDYLEALESVCKTDGWEIMGQRDKKAIVGATWQQKTMALAVAWGLI